VSQSIKSTDVSTVTGLVVLNPDGTAIGTPVGGATSANQTSGDQKTQIVDGGGEVATITGGKLDVNATSTLGGQTIPVSGTSEAVAVQIVDTSGNQIASFGGGVQYTEGATDSSITGTAIIWEDGGETLRAVSAAKPLPVLADLGSNNDVTVTSGDITETNSTDILADTANMDTNLGTIAGDTTSLDTKVPAQGQALAAASVPVVLTAAQVTTLTPPVAITGFATSANQQTDGLTDTELRATAVPVSGTVTANLSATDNAVLDAIETATEATQAAVEGTLTVGSHAVTNAGTFATQATLQTGSAAIGKLAANTGVDIGDVDVTTLPALVAGTAAIGSVLPSDIDVTAHTNYARKYYTSATPTDGIIWSPAAGKRWHIVTMYINVSADSTITLEDDKSGGDDPVWKGEIAANSGVVLSFTEHYPMASGEDAADLTITATAGTVYVTCVGYEI